MRVIKKRALRKHGVEGKSSSSNKAVGGVGVKDAEEGEVEAGELKG